MDPHQTGRLASPPTITSAGALESAILPVARILVLIAGLGIAALGLSCSAIGLIGVLLEQMSAGVDTLAAVQTATFSASFVVLTSTLGLALAWHAWRAIQGRPSAIFCPPAAWPLLILFLLALAVGQIVLSRNLLPALTFPLAHVAAAVTPPLVIVALAGRTLSGVTRWRTLTLQLTAGAILVTPVALALEIVILLFLFFAAMAAVAIQPGGEQILTRLADSLSRLQIQDPNAMLDLLNVPLVAAGAAFVVSIVVPLLEELVKTAGIGLMVYRRPGRAEAVLWGLAAGAGFAIVEGLFNTLGSLDAWALVVVLRIGATLLHCFTGALMGLAWHYVLARRWWRTIGLYIGAVAVHAAWNGLSIGMAVTSLEVGGGGSVTPDVLFAGAAPVILLVLIATLAGGMAAGLTWLTRRVAADDV